MLEADALPHLRAPCLRCHHSRARTRNIQRPVLRRSPRTHANHYFPEEGGRRTAAVLAQTSSWSPGRVPVASATAKPTRALILLCLASQPCMSFHILLYSLSLVLARSVTNATRPTPPPLLRAFLAGERTSALSNSRPRSLHLYTSALVGVSVAVSRVEDNSRDQAQVADLSLLTSARLDQIRSRAQDFTTRWQVQFEAA